MENTRVPTNYAVTRKQKRYIARQEMAKKGEKKFCKHSYSGMKTGNFTYYNRLPSSFAEHWKEYTEVAV